MVVVILGTVVVAVVAAAVAVLPVPVMAAVAAAVAVLPVPVMAAVLLYPVLLYPVLFYPYPVVLYLALYPVVLFLVLFPVALVAVPVLLGLALSPQMINVTAKDAGFLNCLLNPRMIVRFLQSFALLLLVPCSPPRSRWWYFRSWCWKYQK